MKIVTGHTGRDHITSADFQALNQGIVGTQNYVLDKGSNFAVTQSSNTDIAIADGVAVMAGVQFTVEGTDELTLDPGFAGNNRNDLICARYTKTLATGVEDVVWQIIKGEEVADQYTAEDPEYHQEDTVDGAYINDFPMFRARFTGLTLTVEPMFTPIIHLSDAPTQDALNTAINGLLGVQGCIRLHGVSSGSNRIRIGFTNTSSWVALEWRGNNSHEIYSKLDASNWLYTTGKDSVPLPGIRLKKGGVFLINFSGFMSDASTALGGYPDAELLLKITDDFVVTRRLDQPIFAGTMICQFSADDYIAILGRLTNGNAPSNVYFSEFSVTVVPIFFTD